VCPDSPCRFEDIGPVSAPAQCTGGEEFDDFIAVEVCCDVSLTQVNLSFDSTGESSKLTGLGASYTLDYGLRNETTFNGEPVGDEYVISLAEDRKIVGLVAQVSDSGINSLTFEFNDDTAETYGTAIAGAVEQRIEISERYFAIGFKGTICGGDIKVIYIYVRTNPDEDGCQCNIELLGNGVCDYPDCYTKECGYDGDDCEYPGCPEECTLAMLYNENCDLVCNEPECRENDNNNCIEGCNCLPMLIGDGVCQHNCNVEACLYDG
jgi:hypothetical protein